MTNDCLVTKLKGSVNNPNLPKFGEFKFDVVVTENTLAPFFFIASQPFTAKITGDGHFYKGTVDAQTDITTEISNVTTTAGYRISPGTSVVSITPKYYLTNIVLGSMGMSPYAEMDIDFSALYFNEVGLSRLWIPAADDHLANIVVDFDKLKFSNLTDLFTPCTVKGNIDNIAQALGQPQTNQQVVVGSQYNVAELNKMTGSIESFIRHINPDLLGTSLSLSIRASNGVTLNGQPASFTITINVDASGDATIVKAADSSLLASYDKETDTFTYV